MLTMRLGLAMVVLAATQAAADTSTVGQLIQESLASALEAEVEAEINAEAMGIQNCLNKCQNIFNNQQYAINTQLFTDTFEFSACRVGCTVCQMIRDNNDGNTSTCFTVCKNTDWLQNRDINGVTFPITKGIIEADKACMFGCVINTCQYVCQGGTPSINKTPENADRFWQGDMSKGCSIKTGAIRPGGFYSQAAPYNYYNNPSGAGGADECCSNAFSLCNYSGDKNTDNYNNLVGVTQGKCRNVAGAGRTVNSICSYFRRPGNCGNSLAGPNPA